MLKTDAWSLIIKLYSWITAFWQKHFKASTDKDKSEQSPPSKWVTGTSAASDDETFGFLNLCASGCSPGFDFLHVCIRALHTAGAQQDASSTMKLFSSCTHALGNTSEFCSCVFSLFLLFMPPILNPETCGTNVLMLKLHYLLLFKLSTNWSENMISLWE